ncbi:MAG: UDP-N-acetylmuramoyl-tripeptide--D-alanyl-D-alanine ligase, partial [Idiomarina sp.]|nr:UDP-N-acetylmuramoyl-tripeptide--D-alanyl-D-alanine ligase [Idiomarina sp.]
EGFGDIWGVARAKSEIAKGLGPDGVIYTNVNSQFDEFWRHEYAARQHKLFGVESAGESLPAGVHIYARDVQLDPLGCARFTLCLGDQTQAVSVPIPGAHNVANAVAAAALCSELGVSLKQIADGIARLKPVPGRMNIRQVGEHLRIIDDTYNANVASAKAALDVLASFTGYRVMVLGDMGELGAHAREYHEEVGAYAIEAGIDNLFTLGVLSQSASQTFNGHGGQHFDNQDALLRALENIMTQQQELTILVKGSRSARMERVVEALLSSAQQEQAGTSAC